jgi:hypothetical protein
MPTLQSRNDNDKTGEAPRNRFTNGEAATHRHYPKAKSDNPTSKGYGTFIVGLAISALLGLGLGYLYFLYQQNQAATGQAGNPIGDNTSQSTDATTDDLENSGDLAAIQPPAVQTTATSLRAPQTLNLQVNDPNGSVMQLTGITFAEDSTTVELTVTNNSRNPIKLNDNQDMVLKDDLGNSYNLVPAPENPELVIQPGTTLDGEFVFLGQIPASASSLTLVTNNRTGGNQANNPKMIIANIPLQR